MKIYPIGTISAASSSGAIDGISYSFFEPNDGCYSIKVHNILTTQFENQTLLTRKKSNPFLTFEYSYDNIFSREMKQIQHFVDDHDDALTSFYLADLSNGITPTSVTDSSSNWLCAIDNTRLFSTVANEKANKAFIWDGNNWKEGDIDTVTTNTSIVVDVDTNNYGNLSLVNANSSGIVYPMYQVYFMQNVLDNFKTGPYIDEKITTSKDGGYMYSGSVKMVGRYKA
jgi:hypothetical protein